MIRKVTEERLSQEDFERFTAELQMLCAKYRVKVYATRFGMRVALSEAPGAPGLRNEENDEFALVAPEHAALRPRVR